MLKNLTESQLKQVNGGRRSNCFYLSFSRSPYRSTYNYAVTSSQNAYATGKRYYNDYYKPAAFAFRQVGGAFAVRSLLSIL